MIKVRKIPVVKNKVIHKKDTVVMHGVEYTHAEWEERCRAATKWAMDKKR